MPGPIHLPATPTSELCNAGGGDAASGLGAELSWPRAHLPAPAAARGAQRLALATTRIAGMHRWIIGPQRRWRPALFDPETPARGKSTLPARSPDNNRDRGTECARQDAMPTKSEVDDWRPRSD